MALWVLVPLLLTGCAWKGEGLVERTPTGPMLRASTGRSYRLAGGGEQGLLGRLDGYRLILEGRRVGKVLTVKSWTVPEGLTGMPVWLGRLERKGVQLGLVDHNSGAFYLVHPDNWPDLEGFVGENIVLEGFVDGPHVVRVLQFDPIDSQ